MFQNLIESFNNQSLLIKSIIVAIVIFIIDMIYAELTKEKFAGNMIATAEENIPNVTMQGTIASQPSVSTPAKESIRVCTAEDSGMERKYARKIKKNINGVPTFRYIFEDKITTPVNYDIKKGKKYIINETNIVCQK